MGVNSSEKARFMMKIHIAPLILIACFVALGLWLFRVALRDRDNDLFKCHERLRQWRGFGDFLVWVDSPGLTWVGHAPWVL